MGHTESHHEETTKDEPLAPLRLTAGYTDKGHEVDFTPDRNLFGMLGALSIVLILTAIGVWQLFIGTADGMAFQAANSGSPRLAAQNAKEAAILNTFGKATPEEGVNTIRVPVANAARLVLDDKARFAPAAPPVGWTHPDDIAR